MATSQNIILDKNNSFTIRVNPWDTSVFEFTVTEVFDLNYTDEKIIFKEIDRINLILSSQLCCLRHNSKDIKAKKSLLANGFYVAENSLQANFNLKKTKTKKYFDFYLAETKQLSDLQVIAARDFHYSRFHEDPYIDIEKAKLRYVNWITSLVESANCWIAQNQEEKIIGFFAYTVDSDIININIVGINSLFQGYGLFFFSSMMEFLKARGTTAKARFSAGNTDVLNVYAGLGFTFSNSLIDYHKWYTKP